MSATKNGKATSKSKVEETTREFESDVLFQKIFDKWYAFSMVDGECLMNEVPADKIEEFSTKARAK